MRQRGEDNQQLLASINHRLGLLDEVSHRSTLLETINAHLERIAAALQDAAVDREAVTSTAQNLQRIAVAMADRLEATEQRLAALEVRLDRLVTDGDR